MSARKLFQIFFHIPILYFTVRSRFTSVNDAFFRDRSVSELRSFAFFGINKKTVLFGNKLLAVLQLIYITVGADLENPCIRFRTSFETNGDGYRCYWELQPDGRYWDDDDGFGAEHDSELILCADMDKNGDFVTPFQIYKIGIRYVIG